MYNVYVCDALIFISGIGISLKKTNIFTSIFLDRNKTIKKATSINTKILQKSSYYIKNTKNIMYITLYIGLSILSINFSFYIDC